MTDPVDRSILAKNEYWTKERVTISLDELKRLVGECARNDGERACRKIDSGSLSS
jgi:hypothetical protein